MMEASERIDTDPYYASLASERAREKRHYCQARVRARVLIHDETKLIVFFLLVIVNHLWVLSLSSDFS